MQAQEVMWWFWGNGIAFVASYTPNEIQCIWLAIHIWDLEIHEALTPVAAILWGQIIMTKEPTITEFRNGRGDSVHTLGAGELEIWVTIIFSGHVTGAEGAAKHGINCYSRGIMYLVRRNESWSTVNKYRVLSSLKPLQCKIFNEASPLPAHEVTRIQANPTEQA